MTKFGYLYYPQCNLTTTSYVGDLSVMPVASNPRPWASRLKDEERATEVWQAHFSLAPRPGFFFSSNRCWLKWHRPRRNFFSRVQKCCPVPVNRPWRVKLVEIPFLIRSMILFILSQYLKTMSAVCEYIRVTISIRRTQNGRIPITACGFFLQTTILTKVGNYSAHESIKKNYQRVHTIILSFIMLCPCACVCVALFTQHGCSLTLPYELR